MSTFVFCVRMAIYHWYRSLLVCTPVCHTSVSQHIHNFTARRICIARTIPWQHVCPTVCLSDSPYDRPTHISFCFLFFCICMSSHSYAQCLCFAFICPYTMCPCICLPHSYIGYCTSFSTCPFSCKCTVVCAKAEAQSSSSTCCHHCVVVVSSS